MLILGGSATVTDLTGMNTIAVSTVMVTTVLILRYHTEGLFPYPPWSRHLRRCRWYACYSALRLVCFVSSLPALTH